MGRFAGVFGRVLLSPTRTCQCPGAFFGIAHDPLDFFGNSHVRVFQEFCFDCLFPGLRSRLLSLSPTYQCFYDGPASRNSYPACHTSLGTFSRACRTPPFLSRCFLGNEFLERGSIFSQRVHRHWFAGRHHRLCPGLCLAHVCFHPSRSVRWLVSRECKERNPWLHNQHSGQSGGHPALHAFVLSVPPAHDLVVVCRYSVRLLAVARPPTTIRHGSCFSPLHRHDRHPPRERLRVLVSLSGTHRLSGGTE